ncbi:hypothetical protein Bca52824_086613 [Brassica carinata]|uniref:NPH3 domain-containing protein n=1 Tax=Brassica carinata TaxID=52824 RepID=A0A8X7P951_BRACI|nr:hypothetical protein Bca52824_086613 [Brassica carinata]
MDGHVGGVLLESRGYRKRTWSFVRARVLEFTGMSLVPLVVCGCGVVYAALVVYAVVGTGALWNVVVIYAMVAALWSVMIGSGAGYIAVFIVHIVVIIICKYSGTLRKFLGKSTCSSNGNIKVIFNDFPGGAECFELVSRFSYNGQFTVVPSNVVLIHYAAKFMEVTKVFLGLKQCQELEIASDTDSLAAKLMDALVEKLELSPSSAASACSPSPDSSLLRFSCDSKSTESFKNGLLGYHGGSVRFLFYLMIVRKFDNLTISRFLFYHQKVKPCLASCNEKREILETIIHTLYVLDRSCVPHNNLFGVSRLALGLHINKSVMNKLELMIGHQLDQATLDNLLVPPPLKFSHLYHVNLKVASLVDQYIAEVAPDPFLKPSKFLSLLTLIPDSAYLSICIWRNKFYDHFLWLVQDHAGLTNGEKLNVIRTLSYEKLSADSRTHISSNKKFQAIKTPDVQEHKQLILQVKKVKISGGNEKLKEHIEGILWRVMELERACLKMHNQMEVIKKRSKRTSRGSNI